MDIIVCIKRVAATDTKIKVAASGKSIELTGVEFVLNPYDEFAVEEALKLKEAAGTGSVTVLCLGSAEAQKELRTVLAMGADKAVLLKDGGREYDHFAIAETLAAYIRTVPHDLVLLGKQAVDMDGNQMAPRLAALLGLPCATEIVKLTREGTTLIAERDIEGAREVVRCSIPCVLSTQKGLNEPRYANLKGIMAAKKKPMEEIDPTPIDAATTIQSLTLPAERSAGVIFKDGAASVPTLIDALKNKAKVL